MPETTARLRYLSTSPTKVRPVLRLITGQDVVSARGTLRLCDRSVARDVRKLLDSAIANAEHNDHVPEDELFVSRAFADEGPTLKRWRPRARGRGVRIRKRTSHITIVVARLADEALEARRDRGIGTRPTGRRPTRRRPEAEAPEALDETAAVEETATEPGEGAAARPVEKPAKKAQPAKKTAKKAAPVKKTAKKAEPAKKAAKKSAKTTVKKKASGTKKRAPRKGD